MNSADRWLPWLSIALSVLVLGVYELRLVRASCRAPEATARSAHRVLRGDWVRAISRQPGTELLAVQALRNSLMSATITASTAALALMGSISLMVSRASSGDAHAFTARSVLEAALAISLFAAYVCSALAMRFYHHAGFMLSLPVGSAVRTEREPIAVSYVQRAGVLYSYSLRGFLFVAPVVAGLVDERLTFPASLALLFVLREFDRPPVP